MEVIRVIPSLIILFIIIFRLWKYYSKSELRKVFWPALILKLFSGGLIGALYFWYYKFGDTISFFQDAGVLAELAVSHPMDYLQYLWSTKGNPDLFNQLNYLNFSPRAVWFSKLTSILYLICGNNYLVIATYYSVFSFAGAMYLVKCIISNFKDSKWPAILSMLFFPSVALWPSGLTKESLAIGCIMFLIAFTIQWVRSDEKKLKYLLSVFLLVWLLWKIKYYYAGLLAPTLMALLIPVLWSKYITKIQVKPIIIWGVTLGMMLILATFSKEMLDLNLLPELITDSYQMYVSKSGEGDFIKFVGLDGTWTGIAVNIPHALVSGLFRPWITDVNSLIKIPVAIENTILIILLVSNYRFIFQKLKEFNLWVFSSWFYILTLASFLALSAPNLGTLTRYKAGWLFVFTFLILYRNPLLEKTLNKIKSIKKDG